MKFKYTDSNTHAQVRPCTAALLQYHCKHRGGSRECGEWVPRQGQICCPRSDQLWSLWYEPLWAWAARSTTGRSDCSLPVRPTPIQSQCQQKGCTKLSWSSFRNWWNYIWMRQNAAFHKISEKNLQWLYSKGFIPAPDLDRNLPHLMIIFTLSNIQTHVCGYVTFFFSFFRRERAHIAWKLDVPYSFDSR